jgi:hypothetical protein
MLAWLPVIEPHEPSQLRCGEYDQAHCHYLCLYVDLPHSNDNERVLRIRGRDRRDTLVLVSPADETIQ